MARSGRSRGSGNPLVNEVIIPLGQKDRFNRTPAKDDAANYGKYVLQPSWPPC
jgi:hypothetical protein